MGRNNRARRQQKQRQRQKKQKTSGNIKRKNIGMIEEVRSLCHPVSVAIANGEPPPPSIMQEWTHIAVSLENAKLRILLVGFIDYLFHEEEATGNIEDLIPYRHTMYELDLTWLYSLLYSYSLISSAQGNIDSLTEHLNSDTLEYDIGASYQKQFEMLCSPFYLFLWAMGLPLPNHAKRSLGYWIRQWLDQSPLIYITSELEKFLKLKSPKPKQKTVLTLEAKFSQIDWSDDDLYQIGLGKLLQLFMQNRVSEKQRNPELWASCPHLSALTGLSETPTKTNWSKIEFQHTSTATLNLINRKVDTELIPYTRRLQFEAFKCRLLSRYADHSDVGRDDFDRQLRQLINLMSSGVPPDQTQYVQHCLDAICEWLANEVCEDHFPAPNVERLRRIQRRRPNDYRVAVLIRLSTAENVGVHKDDSQITFDNIHFGLFFEGLSQQQNTKQFLKTFYWPLTNEIKKDLFLQFCRRVFLGMNDQQAWRHWNKCRKLLVDNHQEPFASIVKGQACEAEALFYIVLANIDKKASTQWLHAEHISSVVRSTADLLTKNASNFNQDQVSQLLNMLATHKNASSLFHTWEPVLTLLSHIYYASKLEPFLRLALQILSQQEDNTSTKYNGLYSACRQIPKLRNLLPSKKKTKKRKKTEKVNNTQDLFGELS